ncbi:MAG: hypothetical protein QT11_C0001G1028 [archaeon GW2011_AR20]|nr:MAG: hypothetical protein QT11_C0001G1028 [archaeon GW2011_AR20]AQS33415.1 hypothetical protein [uncultured archaeon]AQS33522.1 hypothetical protein [uncultured archaeon]AQS34560.1 hypothetical protein [uncultured archaeon]MBS3161002.1 hypothetical protein [Candidatus Woesearchaeota archaeon]
MKMNRRSLLIRASQVMLLGGTAASLAGKFYFDNENPERLKPRDNKTPADLHVHLPRNVDLGNLILNLSQPGLIGLATYNNKNMLLSYHDIKGALKEIDPGILGVIVYDNDAGYVLNVQEINAEHHISALGCKEKITAKNAKEAIKEIKKQNGLAILNHPYIVPGGWTRYRLINKEEEKIINELAREVDEIEVFNGQCINAIPSILDMREANEKAQKFARKNGFKGIATSDTHMRLEQVLTSGIYINGEDLTFKKLKEYIIEKKFESVGNYVSRGSFVKGHFPSLEYIF